MDLTHFLDPHTGEEVPWPTYEEAARRIVQQWMDSPGHRNNLLNPEVRRLACGTALSRSALGGEVIHSVQVFVKVASRR
ncbi:CAP domain-containing protein [Synoicihabitans lomoniglobus]|uniref:CAP domain-containing protein n=1 Tax=Synoicihabitans lomoniglobus TaxID=2909285 RepID=A0AAF0A104_9BACT|nr:CAP domain-containing protein [Opitutaceae bacterium LMO-M01]WED64642.1 CAP domain-containing protein [Opitutaceae bacterium LMO-M01]